MHAVVNNLIILSMEKILCLWFCFRKSTRSLHVQSLGSILFIQATREYGWSHDKISNPLQQQCSRMYFLLTPTNHLLAFFCISQVGICSKILVISQCLSLHIQDLVCELLISLLVQFPKPLIYLTDRSLQFQWVQRQKQKYCKHVCVSPPVIAFSPETSPSKYSSVVV